MFIYIFLLLLLFISGSFSGICIRWDFMGHKLKTSIIFPYTSRISFWYFAYFKHWLLWKYLTQIWFTKPWIVVRLCQGCSKIKNIICHYLLNSTFFVLQHATLKLWEIIVQWWLNLFSELLKKHWVVNDVHICKYYISRFFINMNVMLLFVLIRCQNAASPHLLPRSSPSTTRSWLG